MKRSVAHSGLEITDLAFNPFDITLPSQRVIDLAVEQTILSASGWRRIFADGEESHNPGIDPTGVVLAAAAAEAISDLLNSLSASQPTIAVATDTRPTGRIIADSMIRVFVRSGIGVRYLFVASAPELMAYTKLEQGIDGFALVSASHNPVGHNGFKFGGNDGAVLGFDPASELIDRFINKLRGDGYLALCERLRPLGEEGAIGAEGSMIEILYDSVATRKRDSLHAYLDFTTTVATGVSDNTLADRRFARLREGCERRRVGIVADLNGSARAASIDRDFFARIGVNARFFNDSAGKIVHAIVPEGESLKPCIDALALAHADDPGFILGYVPDNDGDRGNLVYFDSLTNSAAALHAQEVFALACTAELAYLASMSGKESDMSQTVIVVNGPTSMRVDRVASMFGARVERTEVGEAFVVSRAHKLRSEGFTVRILGEGSNGGTIVHPSTVRDPLSTISAMLKFLFLPNDEGASPWELFCSLSGLDEKTPPDLATALGALPRFTTTGAYETRAIMKLQITDQVEFRRAYESAFETAWKTRRDEFEARFGFVDYRMVTYVGLRQYDGVGDTPTHGSPRGGMKTIFSDASGVDRGFVWMRGSGTEPVFRVLADVEGDDAAGEAYLLAWQKNLVRAASR